MKNKEDGVGLYGGTFDPLHNGHIRVASVIKQLPFVKDFWIHVNHNPYYKTPMFSFEERMLFAEEFVGSVNAIKIQEQFTCTYEVLRKLRRIYGKKIPIYFFVGKEWDISGFKNAEYVKKNCIPITLPKIEISVRSTKIREMIKRKESLVGLVPENVWLYIKENIYVYS